MMGLRIQLTCLAVALLALLTAFPAAAQCDNGREGILSDTFLGTSAVEWRMLVEHRAVTLTVSAPCGLVIDRTYKEGESPFFSLKEIPAANPDGVYTWQLRIAPYVDPEVEKMLMSARESGDDQTIEYELRQKNALPAGPFLQTGSFSVVNGGIVPQQEEERQASKMTAGVRPAASADNCPHVPSAPAIHAARLGAIVPAVDGGGSTRTFAPAADGTMLRMAQDVGRVTGETVISGNLTVYNSLCVGFDCLSSETYGADTIRLKENNLRIHFEDTSAGSFPSRDWRIEINSQTNGGQSHFRINDVDGARSPFTIEAAAPSHSLYVDSTGRIGRKTANPILDLHIVDGDSPGIRLEQDTSSGFGAQTWDIAGNETNFFVRDATGGSTLPFRIFPGSPSGSLVIRDGEVGMGVTSPSSRLHLASGLITVGGHTFGERASAITDIEARALRNFIMLVDSDNDSTNASFVVSKDGSANSVLLHVKEDSTSGFFRSTASHPIHVGTDSTNGNGAHVTAGGTWVNGSSRWSKQGVARLGLDEAVATLQQLEPVHFQYIGEPNEKYVGFIAEDVPEMVAQGDRKTLSPMDIVAVLTKVVQDQQKVVNEQQRAISELHAEVNELRGAVAAEPGQSR